MRKFAPVLGKIELATQVQVRCETFWLYCLSIAKNLFHFLLKK